MFKWSVFKLLSSALRVEAVVPSETSVPTYKTTSLHNPEKRNMNLISCTIFTNSVANISIPNIFYSAKRRALKRTYKCGPGGGRYSELKDQIYVQYQPSPI